MTNTTFIGIDPGKTGAIAVIKPTQSMDLTPLNLFPSGAAVGEVQVYDMPVLAKKVSPFQISELFQMISREAEGRVKVGLERAQAMPKQGVVSMFGYGVGYGVLIGILSSLGISFQEITPQKWKKEFNLVKKEKDESVRVSIQLFPGSAELLRLKKHHGRADAILIAEWMRRKT